VIPIDDVIVQDAGGTRCDCAHRRLPVSGNAKLAYHKDIKRNIESFGNLVGNRDAAPRQPQHDDIGAIGMVPEFRR
jgi:hypothetical protein